MPPKKSKVKGKKTTTKVKTNEDKTEDAEVTEKNEETVKNDGDMAVVEGVREENVDKEDKNKDTTEVNEKPEKTKKKGKKKSPKKRKKRKKKAKKLSKKEKARLLQELIERTHLEKITTRLRRLREKEQRRLKYMQMLQDKEKQFQDEIVKREDRLLQTVDLFKDQDVLFKKWEMEEKEKDEWETFLRCDPLPLPYDVPGLNTYLYLWRKEKSAFRTLEKKVERLKEVIKLLSMVDDFLDNPVDSTKRQIDMLKEARNEVRNELQMHLDMSSYIILRQLDQMKGEGHYMGEPEIRRYSFKPCPDISLYLWAPILASATTSFEPPPIIASTCDFSELGFHVQLPPHAIQPKIPGNPRPAFALRALHVSYDHYSDRCPSSGDPPLPAEYTTSLMESVKFEVESRVPKKLPVTGDKTAKEPDGKEQPVSTPAPDHAPADALTSSDSDASSTTSSSPTYSSATATTSEASTVASTVENAPDTDDEVLGTRELQAMCKDKRALNLTGGLTKGDLKELNKEGGWDTFARYFMSERELFTIFANELYDNMAKDSDDLISKYDFGGKIQIPSHSIAFGRLLVKDPSEEALVPRETSYKLTELDILFPPDEQPEEKKVEEAEEEKEEEDLEGENAQDLIVKPGEVQIEDFDVEYTDSSEELPVLTKKQDTRKRESTKSPADFAKDRRRRTSVSAASGSITTPESSSGAEWDMFESEEDSTSKKKKKTKKKEVGAKPPSGKGKKTKKKAKSKAAKKQDELLEEDKDPMKVYLVDYLSKETSSGTISSASSTSAASSTSSTSSTASTSQSTSTISGSSTADEEDSEETGEEFFDEDDEDDDDETAWRKEYERRKLRGGKVKRGELFTTEEDSSSKTSDKGAETDALVPQKTKKKKKGGKKGGKKGFKKGGKGSPKKKKGGKKKGGKKKGGKKKKKKKGGKKKKGRKKKKKEPLTSLLTPNTPEDEWVVEEKEELERTKEREKEYGQLLRSHMIYEPEDGELNLRRYSILSGVTHLDLLEQPPQPYQLYGSSVTITRRTLLPVSKTLRALDISDSLLSESRLLISLLASFSGKESSLEKLGFSSLGLNRMPTKALELVSHSLINLSLNGNYFNTIGKRCFPQMKQLKTLDLRQCDIKSLAEASFSNLPKLTTLLLSYNRISSIDGVFLGLKFLTRLDFSHNLGIKLLRNGPHNYRPFSNDSNLRPQTFQYTGFPTSLISLDLSFTEINKIQLITFKGLFNLKYLSICYTKITGLVDNLHPFKDLNNLTVLEMSGNTWLESNFVSWIFDGLISIQELYLDSVSTGTYGGCNSKSLLSSKSLRPFQLLSSLSLLSLKNNYICNLTQSIFSSLVNLETLYLSNNRLLSWEIPIFSENKNLNTLTLHENQLNYISDTMLSEFKIVSKISLFNNPFLCNCKVWELAMLANSGVIHVVDWNKTDYHLCIDRSGKNYRNFDGEWGLGCQNTTEHKDDESRLGNLDFSTASWSTSMTYILVIFACIFIVLSFFIYRKWNYIRYLGRLMKNMAVIGLMSNEEKTPEFVYNYDVFVSYCDHDRAWVLNELLPNLELKDDSKQPGPAFKVCLHERDFQVGYSILENIISCMDNSRMILLVVSATFLRSQWCQFEMHLAQHRLLETRRDDLLLVLLEEIPRTKRPKTLHYLMKTKTYLVWDTENSQDLFWKRLRRAIKPNSAQLDKSISSFP